MHSLGLYGPDRGTDEIVCSTQSPTCCVVAREAPLRGSQASQLTS